VGSQGLMRSFTHLAVALALVTAFAKPSLAASPEPTREAVEQAYDQGEYRDAAVNGARLLAQNKDSAEQQASLRFKVANSLAWTGRYDAAIVQYEKLFGSSLEAEARIGIASIMRWRGMPDVAHRYLQAAKAKATNTSQIQQAQAQLDRDLRPALNVRLSDTLDNSHFGRRDLSVGLRYWSDDKRFKYDVGSVVGDDRYLGSNTSFRSLNAGAMAAGWWGAPRLYAAVHQTDKTRVFGSLELEPLRASAPELLVLRAASVDYARLAFNARAPLLGLRATNVGVRSRVETALGNVAARADLYRISDSNRLVDADVKPPLGSLCPLVFWSTWVSQRARRRRAAPIIGRLLVCMPWVRLDCVKRGIGTTQK
jgi:tetratricopeptide (TPR) repeat protein